MHIRDRHGVKPPTQRAPNLSSGRTFCRNARDIPGLARGCLAWRETTNSAVTWVKNPAREIQVAPDEPSASRTLDAVIVARPKSGTHIGRPVAKPTCHHESIVSCPSAFSGESKRVLLRVLWLVTVTRPAVKQPSAASSSSAVQARSLASPSAFC